MHKTVIAQINADMGKCAVEGVEEDQISRQEFDFSQWLRGFADRMAVARQHEAGCLPEHMADKESSPVSGEIPPRRYGLPIRLTAYIGMSSGGVLARAGNANRNANRDSRTTGFMG